MNDAPTASGLPMGSRYGPSGRSATATPIASPCAQLQQTYQYHFPLRSTAWLAHALSSFFAQANVSRLSGAPRLFQLTRSSLSKTNHSFILKNLASFSSCPVNMYTLSPCTNGAGSGVNTPFTSGLPAMADRETADSAAKAACAVVLFMRTLYHLPRHGAITLSGGH